MRILIASHESLAAAPSGRAAHACAYGLATLGHDVRLLVVEGSESAEHEPNVRRVLCHADAPPAPLRFGPPVFDGHDPAGRGLRFTAMSDRQLTEYRDVLREEFDRQIDLYDPSIVHCQHVFLFGHLALEAGVPYVLSAYGDEFAAYDADPRYRRFMQEAAENAGRILTHDAAAARGVEALVGSLEGRVVPFPLPGADQLHSGRWWQPLPQLYSDVVVERFGRLPDEAN